MADDQQLFKPGDVVELISGGQPMTVLYPSYGANNDVHVGYFTLQGEYKVANIVPAALRKPEPKRSQLGGR